MNYDDLLDDANDISPDVLAATHDRFDAILGGLAIIEAHKGDDEAALRTLLASNTPGSALHSVLLATELLVEVIAIESRHSITDLVDALRRQTLRHQATHCADGTCPDSPAGLID